MKAEPKVFLIASSRLRGKEVAEWLEEVGGTSCLDHTPRS